MEDLPKSNDFGGSQVDIFATQDLPYRCFWIAIYLGLLQFNLLQFNFAGIPNA